MRAFVDQVHEGVATVLLGEDESVTGRLPVNWLPRGVKEGLVLRTEFQIDPKATREGKRRVQSLLDSLPDQLSTPDCFWQGKEAPSPAGDRLWR